MNPLSTIQKVVILALAVLCLVLMAATWSYRGLWKATSLSLQTQNSAIKSQAALYEKQIAAAKQETIDKQKVIDERAKAQEKTDEDHRKAIAAITAADDKRVSVSVRAQPCVARPASPGPATKEPADAQSGSGDSGTTSGVLGLQAEALFKRDRDDIERLQSAVNSCQSAWPK